MTKHLAAHAWNPCLNRFFFQRFSAHIEPTLEHRKSVRTKEQQEETTGSSRKKPLTMTHHPHPPSTVQRG